MPKIFPIVKKTIQQIGGDFAEFDVKWVEDIQVDERLGITSRLKESVEVADNLSLTVRPEEEIQAKDDLNLREFSFKQGEEIQINDLFSLRLKRFELVQVADEFGIRPRLKDEININDFLRLRTIRLVEEVQVNDLVGFIPGFSEEAQVNDLLGLIPVFKDEANVDDKLRLPRFGLNEEINANDFLRVKLGTVLILGDAYTSEASPDTNFELSEELQIQSDLVVGAQGKRAYLKFDFRNAAGNIFGNLSDDPSDRAINFIFHIKNSDALAQNCQLYGRISATDPFTENTITWNNQPALGTKITDISVGPNSVYEDRTLNLGSAFETNDVLGNWLQLAFTVDDITVLGVFTVRSRENSLGTTVRPRLQFRLKR